MPLSCSLDVLIEAEAEHRSLRSPRILSLDGGGVRGVSTLLILRDLMRRIEIEIGASRTLKPCEYFDLIGGTSTGGLIAIMLGRLRMVEIPFKHHLLIQAVCARLYRRVL
jgi:hypothetical protein